MYANANMYEMRLPRGYVDLSAEELEYDGSFSLKSLVKAVVIGAVVAAVGAAITIAVVGTGGLAAPLIIGGAALAGGVSCGVGNAIDQLWS
jgi:hypothetical protein